MKNAKTGKFWSMVFCICLLTSMLCMSVFAGEDVNLYPELITNGNFESADAEDATKPAGWAVSSSIVWVTDDASAESTQGKYMKILQGTSPVTSQIRVNASAEKPIETGKLYQLSFMYKSTIPGRLSVYEYDVDDETQIHFSNASVAASTTWKKHTVEFTTVQNDISHLIVSIGVGSTTQSTGNTFCFDDVSLTLTPPVEILGDELLSNGGFEKTDDASWTFQSSQTGTPKVDTTKPEIVEAADAHGGGKYVKMAGSEEMLSNNPLMYTAFGTGTTAFPAGEKYIVSLWYKSDVTFYAYVTQRTGTAGSTESSQQKVTIPASEAWRQISFVVEMDGTGMPKYTRLYIGYTGKLYYNGNVICIDDVSLRKVPARYEKINFYKAADDAVEESTNKTAAAADRITVLGEELTAIGTYTGKIRAAYISEEASQDMMILATYSTSGGAKQLKGISIGTAADLVPVAEMAAGNSEIRAFVWDGITTLGSTVIPATLTK